MFRFWLMMFLIPISGLMVVGNLFHNLTSFILLLSFFDGHHWGHVQDFDDPHEGSSHIFSGIPRPIQSVQRAEFWGVILALKACSGIHVGIIF